MPERRSPYAGAKDLQYSRELKAAQEAAKRGRNRREDDGLRRANGRADHRREVAPQVKRPSAMRPGVSGAPENRGRKISGRHQPMTSSIDRRRVAQNKEEARHLSAERSHGRKSSVQKKPRRKSRYRVKTRAKVLIVLLIGLILFGITRCVAPQQEKPDKNAGVVAPVVNPIDRKLSSDSAIVVDLENNKILYSKEPDAKRYPASLTKMMTLYVAIKENKDLDRTVVIPESAFTNLYEEGAATSGLMPGEALPFKDLLYAMMLPSGADAAKSIAILTAESESDFVKLMNDSAADLGMKNTYFTNVTGLQDPKQITTARDMALLLRVGVKDKTFRKVITSMEYVTAPTAQHPEGLALAHSLKKQKEKYDSTLSTQPFELIGGKTGYTPEAGICLASIAKSTDGRMAIAVTLRAHGDSDNYYPIIEDACTLYDIAFE